ncbi:MAG: serine/threonine protein kinase, partial [Archangium sp.]|nr:serine/threonine protein kinase [Archangium sp.]
MSTRGPESGAGWSDTGPEPDRGAHEQAFATPAATRYELHDLVGSGGTAEVHLAFDRRLGREVALKRLAGNDADGSAARLEREAWMTARLEHPGIVPVYDAGCGPDGRRFYAMRLVRGQSFGDVLAAATTFQQRLALLRRFLAVCHAIAFAHDRRIVHRDLKPANLMLGEFGDTVVVDWGLAVDLTHDAPTASAVGTPGYMAPEQARGEPVSERSDVWALGAILCELLTGAPLISARSAAESEARARTLASPFGDDFPAELRAVAAKAIAFDPAGRYPSAGALAADLEAFLDGRRVGAHEYSSLELLRRVTWAWRWPLAALAVGLIITAIAVGLTWRRVLDERQRAVTAEARARSALEVERASAARALVSRAVLAHELGSPAVAETLAATALVNDEAPDARGVLAGAHAGPRPASGVRDFFAPCQRWWDATADARLCLDTAGGNSVFRLDGGVAWRNEEPWADAVFV